MIIRRRPWRAAIAGMLTVGGIVAIPTTPAQAVTHIEYTYIVRGLHNTSSLSSFATQAAETYADVRGWGLGGSITFRKVSSGGNFTLWLASAADLPGFGPPCDSGYSCTAGRNVIINETRWLHATSTWVANNRSLRDYRHLVINHETGHWLGFSHAYCGGPGHLAPVMQQQSISLQGCKPNPWPLASERQTLARMKGVPIRNHSPIGHLDGVSTGSRTVHVRGWAIDPDTSKSITVNIDVDLHRTHVLANLSRADIAAAYPSFGPLHGFNTTVSAPPGTHRVCVGANNAAGGGKAVYFRCVSVTIAP